MQAMYLAILADREDDAVRMVSRSLVESSKQVGIEIADRFPTDFRFGVRLHYHLDNGDATIHSGGCLPCGRR
jgi:hypothetical protein